MVWLYRYVLCVCAESHVSLIFVCVCGVVIFIITHWRDESRKPMVRWWSCSICMSCLSFCWMRVSFTVFLSVVCWHDAVCWFVALRVIHENQLSGSVPAFFGNFTQLHYLYVHPSSTTRAMIWYCHLGDVCLCDVSVNMSVIVCTGACFGRSLSVNQFSGPLPDTIGGCVNLAEMYARG